MSTMPGSTHLPPASITSEHPVSSSGRGLIAATRPSRIPMLRIADGAPVPSNQRPLRITVSKLMGDVPFLGLPGWLPGCGRDTSEVLTVVDDYLTFVDMSVVRGTSLSGYPRLVAELGSDPAEL